MICQNIQQKLQNTLHMAKLDLDEVSTDKIDGQLKMPRLKLLLTLS